MILHHLSSRCQLPKSDWPIFSISVMGKISSGERSIVLLHYLYGSLGYISIGALSPWRNNTTTVCKSPSAFELTSRPRLHMRPHRTRIFIFRLIFVDRFDYVLTLAWGVDHRRKRTKVTLGSRCVLTNAVVERDYTRQPTESSDKNSIDGRTPHWRMK